MAWMQLAASVLGGMYANKQAKKAQGAANTNANWAMDQSQQQAYQGMFGGYDPKTGEFLNNEWGNRMNQYMNRSTNAADRIQDFSPEEYADQQYQTDLALLNPELEQQALGEESRLAQQGRLNTTGGAGQYGGLMQAQNMNRMKLRQQSWGKSQDQLDNMRRREYEDVMAAQGIGKLAGNYGNMSLDQARFRSGNAWNAANMKSGAALGKAGAMSSMIGSGLQGFNSQEGMSFGNLGGLFGPQRPAGSVDGRLTATPTPYSGVRGSDYYRNSMGK